MSKFSTQEKICIVGAGMSGSLLAIYLARKGYQVEIYERRPDMRKEQVERGRSINMTLARRGLQALEEAGVLDSVIDQMIPLRGRMIHAVDGGKTFQPYGKNKDEVIYSIIRNKLNICLLEAAEAHPNITLHFNKRCVGIDKNRKNIQLRDEESGEVQSLAPSFIIGADGAFSVVRQQMQKEVRAYYHQEFLDWGYKELTIPPGPDGKHVIEADVLHIWPRGDFMLLAMPNRDGSFTCTCILPFEGENSFDSLRIGNKITHFFAEQYTDALPLIPDLVEEFKNNPMVEMITTSTSPWYFKDQIVLIGDACHAVVPFYGQGMNAAFEDCKVLAECLGRDDTEIEERFARYQRRRKVNTDALAELSKDNFIELRKRVKSPMFIARKKIEVALNRLFPKAWMPLYTMMAHTTMPYAEAARRFRRRNQIARYLGFDLLLILVAAAMTLGQLVKLDVRALGMSLNWILLFKRPLVGFFARSNRQD